MGGGEEAPLRVQRGTLKRERQRGGAKVRGKRALPAGWFEQFASWNAFQFVFFFSSFFSFSFFSSSFFLFFLSGVHQLVFASGLNADLNTKRETAILLRPWGLWTTRRPCETTVYSPTGRSDRNETKSFPLLKEIFPDFLFTVLIGYKLIRARFLKLVRVCVWKTRRNKVGSKWLVMYRVIRKVWYIECIILIERKNLFDFFFFLMKGIDLDISIGRSFTIRWYKVIYFFDVIWICFICIADNLWSDKELLPLISQCYTY